MLHSDCLIGISFLINTCFSGIRYFVSGVEIYITSLLNTKHETFQLYGLDNNCDNCNVGLLEYTGTHINSKYLINCADGQRKSGIKMTYDKYRHRFENIRDGLKLNPKHRAHDPRKQFISMAKKYNLDEYAIKYIVGHRIYDVTEKVYTDRTVQWLKDEMEKIK